MQKYRKQTNNMKTIRLIFVGVGALLLVCILSVSAADTKKLLIRVKDVPLPGGATRFDYQSFDPTTGRLYLSHMGDGDVVVFYTQTDKVVANVRGLPTVTGVLVVPSVKACYASAPGNHEIAVIDTEKLAVTKRIPDGKFPDGLAYSPETHKLFISDESGGVETVIDVRSNERIDTIKMGGEVGNTQYDPVSHLAYACVQTRNDFVEINPATNKIQARYPLPGSEHPHGFYIDDENGKAYIACEGNNKLLVFNMKTHAVEAAFPLGDGPDVLAFDRGLQLLYVACESGVVSVFKYGDNQLRKIGDFDVGPNSHSVSVDPKTHKIYFPLKNVNGMPLLRIMTPALAEVNQ
jgi:DNA-binding beta-propeller fold protein YncE